MLGVAKSYRQGALESYALRDISLDIEQGEFVALTGPSGSGKTSFLNIAGLLDPHFKGEYLYEGQDIGAMGDDQRSALRNRTMGFIFQSFNLIPDLTVRENVEVPLAYAGFPYKKRRARALEHLERLGLAARQHSFPRELSGGQQQRVAIARALAVEPSLVLADEPTGNLDTAMARNILELLAQINAEGSTVIMVTHDANVARRAHRNIHIVDGQLTDYRRSPFSDDIAG